MWSGWGRKDYFGVFTQNIICRLEFCLNLIQSALASSKNIKILYVDTEGGLFPERILTLIGIDKEVNHFLKLEN